MKSQRSNRFPIILIILVIAVAGGGVFVWFQWFRGGDLQLRKKDTHTEFLLELDGMIGENRFGDAGKKLKKMRRFSGSGSEWVSLLKRCYRLGQATGDYTPLLDYTEKAVSDLPGNESLRALHVFALLKNGKNSKAAEEALKNLTDSRFNSLSAEAALKSDPGKIDESLLKDNSYWQLVKGDGMGDPSFYEELALETGDSRLYSAAAITWMMAGRSADAAEQVGMIADPSFDLLAYHIYYDNGDFDKAADKARNLTYSGAVDYAEGILMEADALMAAGKYDDAERLYSSLISEKPQASWIPYINTAWLYLRQNNMEAFTDVLAALADNFGENPDVKNALALLMIQVNRARGEYSIDPEYLARFTGKNAWISRAMISSGNHERYRTMLWELFNRNRNNEKIAQYFCWYLLGLRDYGELVTVLDKSEEWMGETEWSHFFRGLVDTIAGDLETGEAHFLKALEIKQRWETLYNLAEIYIRMDDTDTAYDYYKRAENILQSSPTDDDELQISGIQVKIARIQYFHQQYDAAARTLSYALDLDPSNLEALLLRKKLEGEMKR